MRSDALASVTQHNQLRGLRRDRRGAQKLLRKNRNSLLHPSNHKQGSSRSRSTDLRRKQEPPPPRFIHTQQRWWAWSDHRAWPAPDGRGLHQVGVACPHRHFVIQRIRIVCVGAEETSPELQRTREGCFVGKFMFGDGVAATLVE